MPTLKPAAFVATLDAAVRHWEAAEARGGRAIVLKSGATLLSLTAVRQELAAALSTLVEPENDRQAIASERAAARLSLRNINSRFTATVRGLLPKTEFVAQLPALPTSNASTEKQLLAAADLADIWSRIDALPANRYPSLTPPLTILIDASRVRPLSLDGYRAQITALETFAQRLSTTDDKIATLSLRRDAALKKARALLLEYRAAIRALFPKDSEQVLTLPKL